MRSVLSNASSTRINGMLRERLGDVSVAPHVAKSWLRCVEEYGIEADAARDTPVLDAASISERQQRFGELLNVARAEMENLYEQIAGSGYAVILCDAEAAILGAITDPSLKREFRTAGLRVGGVLPAALATTVLAPSARNSATSGALSFTKSSAWSTRRCTRGSFHSLETLALICS